MKFEYVARSEAQSTWDENLERLALEARQITKRIMDKAKEELSREFRAALDRGEILELESARSDLKRFLLKHAVRELNGGMATPESG
jgi:hypothetical protein